MKSKTFLTLAICAVAASLFSGCSTQKTRTGRNNSFFGGLVSYNTGSYLPVKSASISADATQFLGRVNPSGDQLSIAYGAITLHDY